MVYKLEIGVDDITTIRFSSKDEIISFLLGKYNSSTGEQLKLIYPNRSFYFFEGEEIDWTR
tara:strand:- start:351 stop:533 length:183 start_codon:yes stop_codon:yes gene_type:complete